MDSGFLFRLKLTLGQLSEVMIHVMALQQSSKERSTDADLLNVVFTLDRKGLVSAGKLSSTVGNVLRDGQLIYLMYGQLPNGHWIPECFDLLLSVSNRDSCRVCRMPIEQNAFEILFSGISTGLICRHCLKRSVVLKGKGKVKEPVTHYCTACGALGAGLQLQKKTHRGVIVPTAGGSACQ